MEDYIEINRAGLTKLDNGRHYEYHNNVYDLLHEVDATKIGVPVEKITQYKGGIDVEGQINRESQASLDTQRMQKADEARGQRQRQPTSWRSSSGPITVFKRST